MERGTDEGQGVLRRDPEQSERAPAPRPATDRAAMPAATANEQLMHAAIHFSAWRPPGSPRPDMLIPPKVPACLSDIT